MKRKYEEEIVANLERAETSIQAAKDLAVKNYGSALVPEFSSTSRAESDIFTDPRIQRVVRVG